MRRYRVNVGGQVHVVDVQEVGAHQFRVVVEGQQLDVTLSGAEEVSGTVISPAIEPPRPAGGGRNVPSAAAFRPASPDTLPRLVPAAPPPLPHASDGAATGVVKAPMPGTITAVEVNAGDTVVTGQVLVKLEAMKMINAIKAPRDGRIGAVRVRPGESVGYGHVLVAFDGA
jgi:biotin carboxyl carrier protein